MAKMNNEMITLRPGVLVEFTAKMVPCDEPADPLSLPKNLRPSGKTNRNGTTKLHRRAKKAGRRRTP
jgi:hypothetical protein